MSSDPIDAAGTPAWLKDRIREYYAATNERSYLAHWSRDALSYHMGLSDENTATLDEAHRNANRYIARRLEVRAGMRVLDAGCGVGGTAIQVAIEHDAYVTGVTIDPAQVAFADRFAHDRGVADRTTFLDADYLATGLAAASFDAVCHVESLCHASDPAAAIAHARELLRPQGRWGCLDCFPLDADAPCVRAAADGFVLSNWKTLHDTVALAEAAGLDAIEIEDLTARALRSATQLRAVASRSLLALRLGVVSQHGDDQVFEKHLRAAIAMSEGLESGAIEYAYVGGRRSK
jgi:cyclopropane fatty-acyl-phospholipid synthase-like methyltransferase